MKLILKIFLLLSMLILAINPLFVQSEEELKTFFVSENIKNLGEFLRQQNYYENITKICHNEECYAIDIHDLKKSLQVVEEKMLRKIEKTFGKEEALKVSLKGFSITKILTE